jgi:beta-hydroxyacyl-ACP dehydratase FabZ
VSETPELKIQAPLDVNQISAILPHRYPFLLIDRIVEVRQGYIVGQKCVTMNEWYFQGHFPQKPVMPGVLQIEAMAQTGAVLALATTEDPNQIVYLAGVDGARFRKPVVPGDVLRIEMTELQRRRNVGRCEGKIFVEGQLVCEATLTFAVGS